MMKTVPGLTTIFLLLGAGGACNKKEALPPPPVEESPSVAPAAAKNPTPPTRSVTVEALETNFDRCIAAFNAHNADGFVQCYTENAEVSAADVPFSSTGRDAIRREYDKLWKSFPDLKIDRRLVLVSGDRSAAIAHMTGTMKEDYYGVRATGNPHEQFFLHVADLSTETAQAKREKSYQDFGQMVGRRGALPGDARPDPELAWTEARTILAQNDETEKANIATANALVSAFNAHELERAIALYADDAKLAHSSVPEDVTGKEAIAKIFGEYITAFPDVKHETRSIWAAGPYVVHEEVMTGTHKGALRGIKATNKSFRLEQGAILELRDGKVIKHWIFQNGLSLGLQLGFAPEELAITPSKSGEPPKETNGQN